MGCITEWVQMSHLHFRFGQVNSFVEHVNGFLHVSSKRTNILNISFNKLLTECNEDSKWCDRVWPINFNYNSNKMLLYNKTMHTESAWLQLLCAYYTCYSLVLQIRTVRVEKLNDLFIIFLIPMPDQIQQASFKWVILYGPWMTLLISKGPLAEKVPQPCSRKVTASQDSNGTRGPYLTDLWVHLPSASPLTATFPS